MPIRYNADVRALPVAVLFAAWCASVSSFAQEPDPRPSFEAWLEGARREALNRGISEATVAKAFEGLEPLPIVVERDRTQAEAVLTVDEYVRRRLTPKFVRTANDHARTERATLRRVSARYGVQSRFLVAVWGLESNFGRFSGVRSRPTCAAPGRLTSAATAARTRAQP